MTPEQFCYWLQGRAELCPTPPTPEEWESIKEHLNLVFNKVTKPGPGQSSPVNKPAEDKVKVTIDDPSTGFWRGSTPVTPKSRDWPTHIPWGGYGTDYWLSPRITC